MNSGATLPNSVTLSRLLNFCSSVRQMFMSYTALSTGDKQSASLSFSGCKMEVILECLPGVSYLCKAVHGTCVPNVSSLSSSLSPNQGVCVVGGWGWGGGGRDWM